MALMGLTAALSVLSTTTRLHAGLRKAALKGTLEPCPGTLVLHGLEGVELAGGDLP